MRDRASYAFDAPQKRDVGDVCRARSRHGCEARARTVWLMAEDRNVAAMADLLAAAMSADLDEAVSGLDVLDWLASAGLTLIDDEGDAGTAYQLLIAEQAQKSGD